MTETTQFDLSEYEFYPVVPVDEIPDGERLFVDINDKPVVILNIRGEFFAMADVCTHDDGPLGDGMLDDHQIICPRHGARFDVRTGTALTLPAVLDAPVYPVRVVDGQVEIGVKKS